MSMHLITTQCMYLLNLREEMKGKLRLISCEEKKGKKTRQK